MNPLQLLTSSVVKVSLEDYQKEFALKRQIKHESTVVEPSIPYTG